MEVKPREGGPEQPQTIERLKRRFAWLQSFDDETIGEISLCTEGEELAVGQFYFDISHPERGIIRGTKGGKVPDGSCYLERSKVRPRVWARLIKSYQETFH